MRLFSDSHSFHYGVPLMAKQIAPMVIVSTDSLDSYIQTVNGYPMLTPEREKELAESLFYHEDIDAAKALVMSHLRFVVHVARGYTGYGLPMADLIQEGNIGLMKAVKRFDPTFGVRLVSFAVYWIKAEIHEFILRNWRIGRLPADQALQESGLRCIRDPAHRKRGEAGG